MNYIYISNLIHICTYAYKEQEEKKNSIHTYTCMYFFCLIFLNLFNTNILLSLGLEITLLCTYYPKIQKKITNAIKLKIHLLQKWNDLSD